jgi:hypothetical protein
VCALPIRSRFNARAAAAAHEKAGCVTEEARRALDAAELVTRHFAPKSFPSL